MKAAQILTALSTQCDSLRTEIMSAAAELQALHRRLEQIVQQLHKNIEVRDQAFAPEFNQYCQALRQQLNQREDTWAQVRTQAREVKPADWAAELALPAKGLNSRARTLSRACDEFITAYDAFNTTYKGFTAAKLNVWLLTSCQTDFANLTAKILFLAREISKHTEKNRGNYARG